MNEDQLKPLYLAGPISGLTYDEANEERGTWEAKQEFRMCGWTGLNPLEGYEKLREVGKLDVWFEDDVPDSSPEQAVHADLRMIDAAAAVFANYSKGDRASIGTAAEIGYAFAKGKPIVTLMADYNPNHHPFVTELSWKCVGTWNDAMIALAELRHQLEALPYA